MVVAARGRQKRPGRYAAVILLAVVVTAMALAMSIIFAPSRQDAPERTQFAYGFDFAQQGPYQGPQYDAGGVASAHRVLSSIPGMYEDTSIMDWGLPDPEPRPGSFDFSAIASRIRLITSTGGTPVVTLCAAPNW